ncbi:MAG: crossover junction endodeoxyribonuclease RuvC [Candidatus Rokubacteria bacterium]|nr:crossover junction endodeoxyribonuclease RuvC [Candidatus Rokubacteria bacterium]
MLGIDPGLVATGYGLVGPGPRGLAVLSTGVISTHADLPLEARVHEVYEGVQKVMEALAPELVVLEDLYTEYRFPRTALMMAHARGVICLAARQRDLTVLALAPGEVKRAVAGHGSASKEQVQHAMQRLLRLHTLPRPSHVADALALAFTGYSRAGGRLQ